MENIYKKLKSGSDIRGTAADGVPGEEIELTDKAVFDLTVGFCKWLNEKGYSISQMAKKTGINEFRFKRAFNAAGRYSKRRIGKILTELYNTDRDIKSGNIDKDVALELIAISACP